MYSKRGQITIFLIVGILILFITAGTFYLISKVQTENTSFETGKHALTESVKPSIVNFVESCIKEIAEPGIYLLGIQGGVIYPEDTTKVLMTENALINYGYLNGVDQLSLENVEKQFDLYLEENLQFCFDDFSYFLEQGIVITSKKNPKAETKIGLQQIIISINYPLQVVLGKESLKLDYFSKTIIMPVGQIIENAKVIGRDRAKFNFGASSSFFVSYFPFDKNTVVYSVSEQVTERAPFTFMFAVKDTELNSAPRLEYIPDVVLRKGSTFQYQLIAIDGEQDIITYLSDSEKVPMSEQGFIEVVFSEPEVFFVTFTAKDSKGLQDNQLVRFVVEEE